MKKRRLLTVLSSLLMVAVLALTLVSTAEERYTGDLNRAKQYLSVAVTEANGVDMSVTLGDLGEYLRANEIDPSTEGYADFTSAYEAQKALCLGLLLDEYAEKKTLKERADAISYIVNFIDANGVDAALEGVEELLLKLEEAKLDSADDYLDAAEAEATAAQRRGVLLLLRTFITDTKVSLEPDGEEEESPAEAFAKRYGEAVFGCAKLFFTEAQGSTDPEVKSATLISLDAYITDFAIDLSTDDCKAFADGIAAEKFVCARDYLNAILDSSDAGDKVELLYALQKYLEFYDMPESDPETPENPEGFVDKYKEFSENYNEAVVSCAQALVDELADADGISVGSAKQGKVDVITNAAAFRSLNVFISVFPELFPITYAIGRPIEHEPSSDDEETPDDETQLELNIKAFYKDYEEKAQAHNDAVQKNKEQLYSEAVFSDRLEGAPIFDMDFNAGRHSFSQIGNLGNNFAGVEGITYENGKPVGDGYFTVRYIEQKHTFPSITIPDSSRGVVIEFDMTTFGQLPSLGVENGSYTFPIAGSKGITYHGVDTDGGVTCTDVVTGDSYSRGGVIGQGGWTHISLVYRPDCYMTLYVDYVEIATYRTGADKGTVSVYETYEMKNWRMGSTNAVNKEFSLDNFIVYTGSSLRDPYEVLTPEQKMILMSEGLKPGTTYPNRAVKTAYDYMAENIGTYFNDTNANGVVDEGECTLSVSSPNYGAMKTAIENYLSFIMKDGSGNSRYTELMKAIKVENEAEYHSILKLAREQAKSPSTLSYRESLLLSADNFLNTLKDDLGNLNLNEGAKYLEALAWKAEIEREIDIEKRAVEYTKKVEDFFKLQETSSILDAYPEVARLTAEFAVSEAHLALMLLSGYKDSFGAAYEKFNREAGEFVSDSEQISNAEQFIALMRYAASFPEDSWEENFTLLNELITTARKLYESEGKIDKFYKDFAAAEATYNAMNPYFYSVMQNGHERYLTELLEKYRASVSFTERAGICARVEVYVSMNDIDETRPTLMALIETLREYGANVREEEVEYLEFLKSNVQPFLKLVAGLRASKDYNERAALLAECDEYAVMVDTSAEGVIEAILYLDTVREELERKWAATAAFKALMATYAEASTNAERFAALTSAAEYVGQIDARIDGAADALAVYNAALADMKAMIQAKNDELIGAYTAVGTLIGAEGITSER